MVTYANHTITVYRNRQIGSANRFSMSATFTAYSADIQPAAAERQALVPDRYGAVFSAWVDSTDEIQEGDEVHDEAGKVYSVRAVQKWQAGGGFADLDHLELTLIAQDAI
jgi:hypothetical protein